LRKTDFIHEREIAKMDKEEKVSLQKIQIKIVSKGLVLWES
jgi:hypothetical protein